MKEYEKIWRKYVESIKEYVKKWRGMLKYEEMLGLVKIPTFSPLYRPWDLGKLQAFSSFEYSLLAKHRAKRGVSCHSFNCLLSSEVLGHRKIPIAWWELSHYCLLYVGSGTWKNSKFSPRFRDWENSGLSCSFKNRPQAKHRTKRGVKWRHDTWSLFFGLASILN